MMAWLAYATLTSPQGQCVPGRGFVSSKGPSDKHPYSSPLRKQLTDWSWGLASNPHSSISYLSFCICKIVLT